MLMIDELRHLVFVERLGTLTAAARAAHLSQPALTASIQRLEAYFDADLLERGRRGATLTSAGAALLPHAQAVLSALDDGRRAVEEVAGLKRGEVRLGAGATACTYLLPPTLGRYRRAFPGIRFLLRETTTDEAVAALHRAELDLAVVTHADGEPWREDPFILVRAPDLEVDDIDAAPFITFLPGTTSRYLLDRYFPDAHVVMELSSIAAVKGHVAEGIGVSLISQAAATRDLEQGRLVEVPDPRVPVMRQLSILHRGAARLTPAAAAFLAMLQEDGRRASDARRAAAGSRAPRGRRRGAKSAGSKRKRP